MAHIVGSHMVVEVSPHIGSIALDRMDNSCGNPDCEAEHIYYDVTIEELVFDDAGGEHVDVTVLSLPREAFIQVATMVMNVATSEDGDVAARVVDHVAKDAPWRH